MLSKRKTLLFLLFPTVILLANCWKFAPQEVSVKLSPEQKFQKITGWAAAAQAAENFSPSFEKYKDKLFDDAVNNLGINRLHMEIRSGTENPKDWFADLKANRITQAQYRKHRYETINDNDDIDDKSRRF